MMKSGATLQWVPTTLLRYHTQQARDQSSEKKKKKSTIWQKASSLQSCTGGLEKAFFTLVLIPFKPHEKATVRTSETEASRELPNANI